MLDPSIPHKHVACVCRVYQVGKRDGPLRDRALREAVRGRGVVVELGRKRKTHVRLRLDRGVYLAADAWQDTTLQAQIWMPSCCFCLCTL